MLLQVLVAMRVDLGSDGVEVIVSVRASVMHMVRCTGHGGSVDNFGSVRLSFVVLFAVIDSLRRGDDTVVLGSVAVDTDTVV